MGFPVYLTGHLTKENVQCTQRSLILLILHQLITQDFLLNAKSD